MGKPGRGDAWSPAPESIGCGRAPGELKHLSTPRKRDDSLSSGERKGSSLNPICVKGGSRCRSGVVGSDMRICRFATEFRKSHARRRCLERPAAEGDSPVSENARPPVGDPKYHSEGLQSGKLGGPPSKAKYLRRPIVN